MTDAAYVDTTAVNDTTYHYVVVAADSTARRSVASNDAAATPNAAAGSGLQLNGTSQYVTLGAAPALNTSDFTLELWFRRTGAGVGTSTGSGGIANAIPLISKGRSESGQNMNYFLGIDVASGVLVADFEDASDDSNHPVSGATPVTSNVWHHAAATYDTTTDTWRLYLDGVLDRTLAVGGDFTPAPASAHHAAIGSALTSTGAPAGFFQGTVDEVRIWNQPRTGAQIQQGMTQQMLPVPGLLARYGFEENAGTVVSSSVPDSPDRHGDRRPDLGPGRAVHGSDRPAPSAADRARRAARTTSRSTCPGTRTPSRTWPATTSIARRRCRSSHRGRRSTARSW